MGFNARELTNIKNSLKHWNITKGQRECVLKLINQANIDNRLLKEIAHLRELQEIDVESERVTHCLELLRFIRNSELGIGFDQGVEQENRWIADNKS